MSEYHLQKSVLCYIYAMVKALTASFVPIYWPSQKGKIHVSAFIHIGLLIYYIIIVEVLRTNVAPINKQVSRLDIHEINSNLMIASCNIIIT